MAGSKSIRVFAHLVLFVGLLSSLLLSYPAPAVAQTSTPTPLSPALPLPAGWYPADGLNIFNTSGSVEVVFDPDLLCNQALHMHRYYVVDPWMMDPPAIAEVRIRQSHDMSGSPPTWRARLRFAYWGWIDIILENDWCFNVSSYSSDGLTLLDSRQICVCSIIHPATCDADPHTRRLGAEFQGTSYYEFHTDDFMVQDHGVLRITHENGDSQPTGFPDQDYTGLMISSLQLVYFYDPYPANFCEYGIDPTETPTPSLTPIPSPTNPNWPTPTETITPTATTTPTATSTLWPTAPGITPSSTPTPPSFSTWTPSPSPTVWQSPMATLASWQITPDASLTPYPTPTTWPPLPTWAPWPTVSFPAWPTLQPSVTPITSTAGLTITVQATPGLIVTQIISAGNEATGLITWTHEFEDQVDFQQVYSYTYDLAEKITLPFKLFRGLEPYMPTIFPHVATMVVMLLIVVLLQAIIMSSSVFNFVVAAIRWVADIAADLLPG